jgi:hypothetical protein
MPLSDKHRSQRVALKGVPQINDRAALYFRRDVQPPTEVEEQVKAAIAIACLEIDRRYRLAGIARTRPPQ